MKKAFVFALYAASVLVAGCETPQTATTATTADKGEGEVITGSRIPRKAGSGAESVGTPSGDAYKQDRASGSR
jgi:hypothetical protein